METEQLPDILPINEVKLKAAYRHPFEYINPRLYQQKPKPDPKKISAFDEPSVKLETSDEEEDNENHFFVDNEE